MSNPSLSSECLSRCLRSIFFLNDYHWLRLIKDGLCCWKRSDNPSLSSLKLYDVWLPFQERQIDHRLQCRISGLWVRLSGNQKLLCERKNAESDPHPCHPFRFKSGKWTEKNAVKLSFSKTGETVCFRHLNIEEERREAKLATSAHKVVLYCTANIMTLHYLADLALAPLSSSRSSRISLDSLPLPLPLSWSESSFLWRNTSNAYIYQKYTILANCWMCWVLVLHCTVEARNIK